MLSLHIFQHHSTKAGRHLRLNILLSYSSNWACLGKNARFPALVYNSLTWLSKAMILCRWAVELYVRSVSLRRLSELSQEICAHAKTNTAAPALKYLVWVDAALLSFTAAYCRLCYGWFSKQLFPDVLSSKLSPDWSVKLSQGCVMLVLFWMLWVNFQFEIRLIKGTYSSFCILSLVIFPFSKKYFEKWSVVVILLSVFLLSWSLQYYVFS